MSGIDRTTILSGPAVITFGGQSFWSKGDISFTVKNSRYKIPTSSFGDLEERVSDRIVEVSFEPDGRFTTALIAVLWPYAATAIGSSIYGATDRPLVIWTRDGLKVTVSNAALTTMPNLRLGLGQTMQGSVKFTGLLAKSTEPATAAAYYSTSTATFAGDAAFAPAEILSHPFVASWGTSAPWDSFLAEGAWDISFGLSLTPQTVDNYGTVDMRFAGLSISAKAVPVGPTPADLLAKLLPNTALGTSLADGNSLEINAVDTGVAFMLTNASLVDGGMVYAAGKKRIGACEWVASRNLDAGALSPLFTLTA